MASAVFLVRKDPSFKEPPARLTAQLVAMCCAWCDHAGHQVTPGYRASASMQRVEAVMVTAQLVAIRCHKKRLIC